MTTKRYWCWNCKDECDLAETADHQRLEHFGTPCTLTQYYDSCVNCGKDDFVTLSVPDHIDDLTEAWVISQE